MSQTSTTTFIRAELKLEKSLKEIDYGLEKPKREEKGKMKSRMICLAEPRRTEVIKRKKK